MAGKILAVDIGGSKLIVGLTDMEGTPLVYEKRTLPAQYDVDFLLNQICALAQPFLQEAPLAAGVTIPGLADREKGIWLYAPFSNIRDVKIAEILRERLGLPVFADNDVNACAQAERRFGCCRNVDDFLWMTVSNGIGGAVCLNGEVYGGAANCAGEVGHFIVEENTENRCGCGNKGCLEAMASGTAIAWEYRRRTGRDLSAKEIAQAAKQGDTTAVQVYQQAGYYIGKAISYCANLLNLETVILGGGVAQDFDLLRSGIDSALKRYLFVQANGNLAVQKTGLGYLAALSGGAAVAIASRNPSNKGVLTP